MLILNICSLHVGELRLAEEKNKNLPELLSSVTARLVDFSTGTHFPSSGTTEGSHRSCLHMTLDIHVFIDRSSSVRLQKHPSHSGRVERFIYPQSGGFKVTTDCTSPFPSWLPPLSEAQPATGWNEAQEFLLYPFPS